jgi:hypothetical protein
MSETVRHLILKRVLGEPLVIRRAAAQAFLEGRRKEAERIDPQTCQIESWYVYVGDVYGIFEETEVGCVDKERFVRNVPDGSWVWDGHLPKHIAKALDESIERETETYEKYLECPKESRQLWEDKYELRSVIRNYAFLLRTDIGTHGLRAYLREWEERHADQLHRRTGDQTIVLLFDLISTVLDIIQSDNKAAEHT